MVKYARFIYLHSQQKQKNQCTYIFDRDFMTGHNEHAYMYLSNINICDVGNQTGMFYFRHVLYDCSDACCRMSLKLT